MAEPLTKEDIQERLKPNHLEIPESQEALKIEILEKADIQPKSVPVETDPRMEKEWTFDFKWKDGNGKVWSGKFVNKILTIRERSLVGITRARLAGGLSSEAIDPLTEEINLIVAHLTFSLQEKPPWAEDIQSLENVNLLQAIYEEVASHEAFFLGWRPSTKDSKG